MNEKRRNIRKRIFRNGENPCKAKKFISNTLTSKESHDLFSVGIRKKLLWHQREERKTLFPKRSSTRKYRWQNRKYARHFCNALNELENNRLQVNSLCLKGVAVCCGITPMC